MVLQSAYDREGTNKRTKAVALGVTEQKEEKNLGVWWAVEPLN